MAFQSKKQEKFMWANNPKLAKKWTNKYGSHKPKRRIKKQKKIT
jgi:hypothetical protein|tara:strand:+ start:257 stop:388 length:132 start_codon:yes stop_codon:yes gene_type:complete